MNESRVMMICCDSSLVKTVKAELSSRPGLWLQVVQQSDDLEADIEEEGLALILVHKDANMDFSEIARLLWINSTLPHPVPVLVLSEYYHYEEARAMFQMGVTDYVSRADHLDGLPWLIDRLTFGAGAGARSHAEPLAMADHELSRIP